LARAGLESLLGSYPALKVIGGTDKDARGVESESPPDVLLVEADTLADPAVREAVDWASAGGPAVLLVHNPAVEPAVDALRAGVKAVLPSTMDGAEIALAIQAAAAGLVVLDAAGVETFLRVPSLVARGEKLTEALTGREVEVLELIAAGLGNKEIAARMTISEHTVKFHVASIMGKLGAGSRTEAVTLGIRHGLIMI